MGLSGGRHWHFERLALGIGSSQTNVLVRVPFPCVVSGCYLIPSTAAAAGALYCPAWAWLSSNTGRVKGKSWSCPSYCWRQNSYIHPGEIKIKIKAPGANLRNCISETPEQFMALPGLGKEFWAVSRGLRKSWGQKHGAGHGHRGLVWPITRCWPLACYI